jgi:hypothetical protein
LLEQKHSKSSIGRYLYINIYEKALKNFLVPQAENDLMEELSSFAALQVFAKLFGLAG